MKILKLGSFFLISMCLLSCGNKDAKSASEDADDTAVVAEVKSEPVEEIVLSFTKADDPCFGNTPDYLHIQGGKPFGDAAQPYKLDADDTQKGKVIFGKFTQEEEGTYSVDISTSSSADDEVTLQITVTDANGTEKTIDYTIPFCI